MSALTLSLVLSSCQNGNNDDPETPQNPEGPINPIVGTWVYEEWRDEGHVFRADGTQIMFDDIYDYDGGFHESSYTFDEATKILTIYYKSDGGSQSYTVTSITNNKITMCAVDDDDTNNLIRLTSPKACANVDEGGGVVKKWDSDRSASIYIVNNDAGSYYFKIEPKILWHENLPPLTLQSVTNRLYPVDFAVTGNDPYLLSVSFDKNTTSEERVTNIELIFSNAENSINVLRPIIIHQEPAD